MKRTYWKLFNRLMSTNHQDIGWNYLFLAISSGILGSILSFVMRIAMHADYGEAFTSLADRLYAGENGALIVSRLTSSHALIMIFLMTMPALVGGFTNWIIPLMIGSSDVAFPKLNRWAFWLLLPAMASLVFFFFSPASWARYILLVCLYLASLSLVLTFINFFTTIVVYRDARIPYMRLPVYCWSVLIASFLGAIFTPVLLAAATLTLLSSRAFGESPQLTLWFFTHPELYIILLPTFGIISQIIAAFSKKTLVGESLVVWSMCALGGLGFIFWIGDLFSPASAPLDIRNYFLHVLPLISLPVIVIVACWLLSLIKTEIAWEPPMYWVMGFIMMVLLGGLSAVRFVTDVEAVQDNLPALISHFHYIVSLDAVFAIFAAWYFWFPKMSGYLMRARLSNAHFWLLFCGTNMMFLPQYFGETTGLLSMVSILGALLACLSVICFIVNVLVAIIEKNKAGSDPWRQQASPTREWSLASPPKKALADDPEAIPR